MKLYLEWLGLYLREAWPAIVALVAIWLMGGFR